jgi:hypothetical protein
VYFVKVVGVFVRFHCAANYVLSFTSVVYVSLGGKTCLIEPFRAGAAASWTGCFEPKS